MRTSTLILALKSIWMPALPLKHLTNRKLDPRARPGRSNWSVKLLTPLRITPMICSSRFHLLAETMLSIWAQCTWDLQRVSQLMSSSIPALNIWPSLPLFAMTRPLETSNSKSMIHFPALSCSAINLLRDAEPRPTICTNLIQIKFSPKHHPS